MRIKVVFLLLLFAEIKLSSLFCTKFNHLIHIETVKCPCGEYFIYADYAEQERSHPVRDKSSNGRCIRT